MSYKVSDKIPFDFDAYEANLRKAQAENLRKDAEEKNNRNKEESCRNI